jgi:hypothetical protein
MEEAMNALKHFFDWPTHLRLTLIAAAAATIVGVAIANAPTTNVRSDYEPYPFDGSVGYYMDLNPHQKTIGGSVYTMYGPFGELGHHSMPRPAQEWWRQSSAPADYED